MISPSRERADTFLRELRNLAGFVKLMPASIRDAETLAGVTDPERHEFAKAMEAFIVTVHRLLGAAERSGRLADIEHARGYLKSLEARHAAAEALLGPALAAAAAGTTL